PKDEPAVYVAFAGPDIGYGVFAARDFEKGEFIFHEAPLIPPTDFCQLRVANDVAHGPTQMQRLLERLGFTHDYAHLRTRFAFPKLAAQMGKTLPTYDDVTHFHIMEGLGMNLKHGQLVVGPGQVVTREEYTKHIQHIQTEVVVHGGGPLTSIEDRTKIAADFFRGYAFQDKGTGNPANPGPGAPRKATVYLLGSLVNHCCTPGRRLRKKTPAGALEEPVVTANTLEASLVGNNDDNDNAGSNNAGNNNAGNNASENINVGNNANDGKDANAGDNANTRSDGNNSDNANAGANANAGDNNNAVESEPSSTQQPDGATNRGGGGRCSPGPNCEWRIGPGGLARFVKPHHIAVQARRPIRAGEELTWDYGKKDQKFTCLCATCDRGPNRACCVL
ncbi:hypothetical protein QBC36DRAFT_183796, partial [Triangularia setosa]